MFNFDYNKVANILYENIMGNIEFYLPKIMGALIILAVGVLISMGIYKLIIFLFKKFKLIELIDKLTIDFEKEIIEEGEKKPKKFSQRIKVDSIVAKSLSYYIFLVFFRFSIIIIGISEVEDFLGDLLAYLPSLFVGIIIGFFGIRFANFIYNIVYHTLNLTKQKTSKIIASGAKIIILFFTLMLVLKYIKIVDAFIINTILVGFISMLALSGGLAFGLGGKDIAKEILESFRK